MKLLQALILMSAFLTLSCNKGTSTKFSGWDALDQKYSVTHLDEASNTDKRQSEFFEEIKSKISTGDSQAIKIEYPFEGSVFPPDFSPVRFMWRDNHKANDVWLLEFDFGKNRKLFTFALNLAPAPLDLDSNVISSLTKVPQPTTAITWKANSEWWEIIKKYSLENPTTVNVYGFSKKDMEKSRSFASLRFSTSKDSVGAPIFYRDVPIMPSRNSEGKIKPLSKNAQRLIKWRLKDVSRPNSKVVMEKISSCANCHSFSADGKSIGIDIDGPQSDKGSYAIVPMDTNISIEREDLISWNHDFKEKSKGAHTLGFLSQVSPSGDYVVTTVEEKLYVMNYMRDDFIQVFYPTRGLLAFYDRKKDKISYLPGADDREYVHCDAVWTPDEKYIVFARAKAKDPYTKEQPIPEKAGDPEETQIQYDLYKMPFNNGKGGKPVPIEGAGNNGMSNTFPKVTPDGKYVVFVKCKNGQLMRPDGKLWIVPIEGGEARLMICNTSLMNSWHSFSPNGRWMVFSSKSRSFYTDMFLTHIDEFGNDTPPIYIPGAKAANRAINIPEFVNVDYEAFDNIKVPAVDHFKHLLNAYNFMEKNQAKAAVDELFAALEAAPDDHKFNAEVLVKIAWMATDKKKGLEYMKKALIEDPSYHLAYFDMGMLYLTMGDEQNAIKSLYKCLSLSPHDPVPMGKLADIYATSSNPKIRNLEKALKLAKTANENSYYMDKLLLLTYSRVLSENKEFQKALQYIDKSMDIFKKDDDNKRYQELVREREMYKRKVPFTAFQHQLN